MTNLTERVRRPRRGAPPREQLDSVRAWLHRVADVRLDPALLDEAEQSELVQLAKQASGDGGTTMLSKGDSRRLERLVEKGAGLEPGEFGRRRDEAKMRAKAEELAVRARRAPARPRFEEQGAVVLKAEWVHGWFDRAGQPAMFIEELGLLVFLLGQLENGKALCPGATIEGAGDDAVLCLDNRLGLGAKFHRYDGLGKWRKDVEHLAVNGLLSVERRGQIMRVSRGPRVRKLNEERLR